MMSESPEPTTLRFSTAEWPAQNRLAIWREAIGRRVFQFDTMPLHDGPFHAETTAQALPELCFGSWTLGNLRTAVTHDLLDGTDHLMLRISLSGTPVLSHRGREVTGAAGDAILMSTTEPWVSISPSLTRFLSLRLRRNALTPLVSYPEDALMRPVPRDTEALKLLTFYLQKLIRMEPMSAPELRQAIVTHIYDLVALVIGATRDAAAVAKDRGLRAARLAAAKADIHARLSDLDLTLITVAARQNLSPRSLQRLFADEGTSFTEFVLNARLTQSHRLLTNPRWGDRNISSLAFEAGFGDLSYFNRTFRRRYGASPSDIRATMRRRAR
ncbi:AraC family transcriptional regulator [Bradyrhizobium sp. C9]|nr:AraC family transcriptional regulator [Bradyrhizobium sp. C9]